MQWEGLLFVAVGVFALVAAALDWDWFMSHYKARFMIYLMGRTGARIFYAILGAGIIVFGLLYVMGVLRDK